MMENREQLIEKLYPPIIEEDGWDKNKQYRDEFEIGYNSAQKRITDKLNHLNSLLKEEKNKKLDKRFNEERIKELEIQVKLLKELMQ